MKFKNGVTIDTHNDQIIYNGHVIGKYHRCNSNYPPSMTTPKGRHIGCNTDEEVANAALAAFQMEELGVSLDGNLFPDETWILRINDISMSCNPEPTAIPKIIAKVHFNHSKVTGSSSLSKPAKHTIMEIDLGKGTFHGKERGKAKEFKFANQADMIAKLRAHIDKAMGSQTMK